MISVAEAQALILAAARPLTDELVPLRQLASRTLAQNVCARHHQPPFDAAVMDGYAVRSHGEPRTLAIVGESAAGRAFSETLQDGEAVRISTGAALPEGANAVVAQEDAAVRDREVRIPAIAAGHFVRPRGGDFAAGETLLREGAVLTAGAVTLLASAGLAAARVRRRPRISIVSTGDELVAPGATIAASQIYNSAGYGAAALAETWGAQICDATHVGDDPDALTDALRTALPDCDVLAVIGSASVGPHDHARQAAKAVGAELTFAGIAMRPGKPTWFARTSSGACLIGLPGNPASALACTRIFVAPLIEQLLGRTVMASLGTHAALLGSGVAANDGRESYLRAIVNTDANAQLIVTPSDRQDSSLVSVLAKTNCLLRRGAQAPEAESGAGVEFLYWSA